MARGIGRNDRCWCGSGKKYKKCHLGRSKERPLPSPALVAELGRHFKVKQCLHPRASSSTCGKIIAAHTIQRAGALASISDGSGHVLSFYPLGVDPGAPPHRVGWREASTFTGFCDQHDSQTFAPLERFAFAGTSEQCFLLAYRAQCHEVYQKQGALRTYEPMRQLWDRGQPPEVQRAIQQLEAAQCAGTRQGLAEMSQFKARMDSELLQGDFSNWNHLFVVFEGPLCVASTGVPTPNRDLSGATLQTLHDPESALQPLYVGVVPCQNGGIVVLTWRPDDSAAARIARDLEERNRRDLPGAVVQFIFAHVENTYFSAVWWESLSRSVQIHVARLARMGNPYYERWTYLHEPIVPWRVKNVTASLTAPEDSL